MLDGSVVADVAEAEAAVTRFNVEAQALNDYETLARLLLRAEAVASSRIEGLEIGSRRLLREEVASLMGERSLDVTASEVLGNVRAMQWAVTGATAGETLEVADLLEIHRRLLEGTSQERFAGRLRDVQNWIGGSGFNPCSAVFVPPPPERVPELLEDLCVFASGEDLPAVVQAAIAHAQFETIHPFVDGNGRTGRALIHVILRRRGLAPRVLPPVSLVLATWSQDYVDTLMGTRSTAEPQSEVARSGLTVGWLFRGAHARRRRRASYEAQIANPGDCSRASVGPRRLGHRAAPTTAPGDAYPHRECRVRGHSTLRPRH
jgi:Fic family protein